VSRGWLLDTNIVSELVKGVRANQGVVRWIARTEEAALYLSVITLGEIEKGIGLAEQRGRSMVVQRDFLSRQLPERFGSRILPFDAAAAIVWGRLMRGLRGNREDERRLAIDAQIAAIAEIASLTLCSRNHRDFVQLGVGSVFDPFEPAAPY
jgi:predicted nucleic acid-binding protein